MSVGDSFYLKVPVLKRYKHWWSCCSQSTITTPTTPPPPSHPTPPRITEKFFLIVFKDWLLLQQLFFNGANGNSRRWKLWGCCNARYYLEWSTQCVGQLGNICYRGYVSFGILHATYIDFMWWFILGTKTVFFMFPWWRNKRLRGEDC